MRFLKIENRTSHAPSIEYFSTLGLSSSRGQENSIGQFGSGFNNMLAVFAREEILQNCKLCLGLDVYTYQVKAKAITDSRGRNSLSEKLFIKKQNGGLTDLNISKEFGAIDWTQLEMGLRELISNGLDGAEAFDGTYESFKLEIVEEKECRAKDGYIRFYVPITPRVQDYIVNLGKNFPCVLPNYDKNKTILPGDNSNCKIYRKGVLVGEFGHKSLFHYNINNICLNECRIVDSSNALSDSARHLAAKATPAQAEAYVREILLDGREDLWESQFNTYSFDPQERYYQHGNKQVWEDAINKVLGNSILVSDDVQREMVESRGHIAYKPKNSAHVNMLESLGVKSINTVLNFHDLAGREIVDTNDNVRNTFDKIWREIEKMNMCANKQKPEIKEYVQNTLAAGASESYYFENAVYIRKDYENDSGFHLIELIIHELGHHITDATDCNRSFEGWAFRIAANLLNEKFQQA